MTSQRVCSSIYIAINSSILFDFAGILILTILTGKEWCFTQFGTGMAGWLILIFSICLHSQLSSIHSLSVQMFEKYDSSILDQIDSKNGWLLLSTSLRQNLGQFFLVEKVEKAGKANRKSIGSSKKRYQGFQISPPFERSACFYVAISEKFEHFRYFNFETDFLEK